MKTKTTNYLTSRPHWLKIFLLAGLMGFVGILPTMAQTYGGGTGTSSNPYLISTKAHLTELQTQTNSGKYTSNTTLIYFKMTTNIDMGGAALCIGNMNHTLSSAVFDGQGYTISNIRANYSWGNTHCLGVFGQIKNSTIKNLTISNFSFYGWKYIGALVGFASASTIENCHVENGAVYGTSYMFTVSLLIPGENIGGLVGYATGTSTIKGCSIANDAIVGYLPFGGISGDGHGVGGLVGTCTGSANISDCLIANKMSMTTTTYDVGGVIGFVASGVSVTLNRIVVPRNCISSELTTSYKGSVSGRPLGTVTCYNSFFYNTSYAPSAYSSNVTGAQSYTSYFPTTGVNSYYYTYLYLERKNNAGATISSTMEGNKQWTVGTDSKFDVTNGPLLSTDKYMISVTFGSDISSLSSYTGYYSSGSRYLYTPAKTNYTATSSLSPSSRQRLRFTYTNNAGTATTLSTLVQGSSTRTYIHSTATRNGTISSSLVNIPYPYNLKAVYDQWSNKVTLSWNYTNTNSVPGTWYIYKREVGSLEGWTRYNGTAIATNNTTTAQTFSYNVEMASGDIKKNWEFAVSFFEGTAAAAPHTYASEYTTLRTDVGVNISGFTATGGETSIVLNAEVPTQLTNSTSYGYHILRSSNGGESFETLTSSILRFNGTGKITYTDNTPTSPCDSYIYRLAIEAFGSTYTADSKNANVTGATKFTSFTATKGEYSNQIRLEWEVSKSTQVSDQYKVFRRIASNTTGSWTQLGTVNTSDPGYIYSDDKAMPGIYYRYRVVLYQVCGTASTELESREDIGFSQSLGTVSGRVTYGSGIAVKEVSVSVVRNDLQTNEAQYRSLYSNGEGKTFSWNPEAIYYNSIINSAFTYQFWLNPEASMTGNAIKVGELGNVFSIYLAYQSATGRYRLTVRNTTGGTVWATAGYDILPSRFSHVTVVRNGTLLSIYVMNDEDPANVQLSTASATRTIATVTATTNQGIQMGYAYKGQIDECRLWSRALTEDKIKSDYNRMLTGAEENLKAYWTFDEGLDGSTTEAGYIFDISRVGIEFNRNHGRHNLTSSSIVPTRDQLALKAISDANGNYQIRGIPFSGEGTSYDIVPTLGVHDFNPTSQLRYISNSSLVHNSTDFTDVSSFEVSGTVVYEGGTYPVTDCNFEVDGKIQTRSNGQAITNNADGSFSISVPIGEHTVRVVKTGHTFANDGYLTMPEGGYNKHESGRFFYDQTRVKLIGRVAGGLTENDKPLGFGESVNNTGASKITLTTARQPYDLQSTSKSETFTHNEGQWKKPDGKTDDQTTVTYRPKNIEIEISAETGEFVAWVYPEVYNIGVITAPGYVENIYERNELIDLSSSPVPNDDMLQSSIRTWGDSVLVRRPGQIDYYEAVEKSDTIRHHAKWKTYYQAVPTFSVTQLAEKTPVAYFGEPEYLIEDALTGTEDLVTLWTEGDGYLFNAPVFRQGQKYTFAFEAYEQYKNHTSGITYPYPIDQGTVNFTNNLALTAPDPISLNEEGKATYTFMAGAPDLTTGKSSFMGTITIGAASYYWDKGIDPIEAWHLGDKTTGTDFMTSGPDEITAILRDPPGSLSYSYIEKGTTITTISSSTVKNGAKEVMNLTTSLGPQIKTFIGLGGGVIIESEVKLDVSAGLNAEQTYTSATETSTTNTFTERFQTSDDPLYVGHLGDVFIGNSTNIQYGLTNGISIQKNVSGETFASKNNYSIAKSAALAYGQTFDTRFAYTQVELEKIMIPKWQDNLAILLLPMGTQVNKISITNPVYVSNLPHDDENFGKLNTDKNAFGAAAVAADKYSDGPSYTIYMPTNYDMAEFKVDSVMWFNNQINGWTNVLVQNEKEKVLMTKLGNYSFGAGASIEWSKTSSSSQSKTTSFNWVLNPKVGAVTGMDVMGIGLELSTEIEYVHEEEDGDSEEKETSITSGFVLKEEGDDDEITVDYGMTASGTIAFKTRGGRTSCPYEGGYISQYFEKGKHILDEATMQIEVPKIGIKGSDQLLNVPANKTASFVLELKNESETGEDVWFQLIVDEATNPHGAELKIDGGIIGNGRMFMVKAGEVLEKTMTVGKGSVDQYEKIGLILRSECQSDPTTFLPVIADTTYFSVEFIPACTEVNINAPANNWIVNTTTDDVLSIVLNNFDRNFANFGYIKLEARRTGSTTWEELMKFFTDENIYNNASGGKTFVTSSEANIIYDWDMGTKEDGTYELRATAVCVNTDNNGVILSTFSEYTTNSTTGIKDMTRPEALGNPSPVNGILAMGDEISITFNEAIQTAMLTKNNFTITGTMNASTIAEPNTGLSFTGTGSAYTELPIVTNGSFSIETWFKRTNGTSGTLFSFGQNDEFISLSFDATGHAIVKIGNESYTSVSAISNTTNTWKYIGLAYNRNDHSVSVYAYQDSDPTIDLFVTKKFETEAPTQGKLYVGNTSNAGNGFQGSVGLMHFYNVAHTGTEMSAVKSVTKSGSEENLIGLWEMTEAAGARAKDKARSRNLVVNADWYIYPAGKSLSLNGTNQYATITSGTFPFRYFDDFTIEMQFKGESQAVATLLSVGMTAYVEFNADKHLVLKAGENTQVLTSMNLLDGNWHHLALSVKRKGMTNVIIDGTVAGSFNSSIFTNDVAGGFYFLGTHYYENKDLGTYEYTQYFKGNIDEVRVWNTALSTALVNQNRMYKLKGNEVGLISYHPFETWEKQSDGTTLINSYSKDLVDDSRQLGGSFTFDNVAAAIIDRPTVETIAQEKFSYVASNNKIVLTIDQEPYRLEGVTFEIAVKNVLDVNGNVSKPALWTAYINRSPLSWQTDAVALTMEYGESKTFKATIANSAGTITDYYIEGLPGWLSVSSSSGTLQPLASRELTFTIDKATNIGSYEALIVLVGSNNIRKTLPVSLCVTGKQPGWSVNLKDFEQTMTITGQVQIEGIPQEDVSDILAAFIGERCVGLVSPVYESALNAYLVYMMAGGNTEDNGAAVSFKFWDASTGNVYPVIDVTENGAPLNITFTGDDSYGTPDVPVYFNALNVVEQSITLSSGWNWISVNVANNNPALADQLKEHAVGYVTQVKASDGSFLNNIDGNWGGTIASLVVDQMYVVNASTAATLNMVGKPVNPKETVITLAGNKWSWIGYTPQFSLPVSSALAGVNATLNDQIKGQAGYRTMSSKGWIGSLNAMEPGHGYKYKSGNTSAIQFNYPTAAASMAPSFVRAKHMETVWNAGYTQFSSNMTVTASLNINGSAVTDGLYEVGAFAGNECRGSAIMQYIDGFTNPYMAFLMVNGDSKETITFRAYNHETGEIFAIEESLPFSVDAIYGNPDETFVLTSSTSSTGIGTIRDNVISIYPNPAEKDLFIRHNMESLERVEIYDIVGKLLIMEDDFSKPAIDVSSLKTGTYFININYNGQKYVNKFIKK